MPWHSMPWQLFFCTPSTSNLTCRGLGAFTTTSQLPCCKSQVTRNKFPTKSTIIAITYVEKYTEQKATNRYCEWPVVYFCYYLCVQRKPALITFVADQTNYFQQKYYYCYYFVEMSLNEAVQYGIPTAPVPNTVYYIHKLHQSFLIIGDCQIK